MKHYMRREKEAKLLIFTVWGIKSNGEGKDPERSDLEEQNRTLRGSNEGVSKRQKRC